MAIYPGHETADPVAQHIFHDLMACCDGYPAEQVGDAMLNAFARVIVVHNRGMALPDLLIRAETYFADVREMIKLNHGID